MRAKTELGKKVDITRDATREYGEKLDLEQHVGRVRFRATCGGFKWGRLGRSQRDHVYEQLEDKKLFLLDGDGG
jgi:hypothetical protein